MNRNLAILEKSKSKQNRILAKSAIYKTQNVFLSAHLTATF